MEKRLPATVYAEKYAGQRARCRSSPCVCRVWPEIRRRVALLGGGGATYRDCRKELYSKPALVAKLVRRSTSNAEILGSNPSQSTQFLFAPVPFFPSS